MKNCRSSNHEARLTHDAYLTTRELRSAEHYLCLAAQIDHFMEEMELLKRNAKLEKSSRLLTLRPFVGSFGQLRVGGRQHAQPSYSKKHPVILHHKHSLTHILVHSEHLRLLHAGRMLLMASLDNCYHILGCRKLVWSITRGCVTCRKHVVRPTPPIIGQLPIERLTPGPIFDKVGIDFAGTIQVKYAQV